MKVYEISAQNRIVGVSGNWDHFALSNGGEAALSAAIMGRPLWDFVAGLETRAYLNALFFAARSAGRGVAVRYRCDSPAEPRLYQLQVHPIEEGGLRLSHVPLGPVPAPSPGGGALCSQCLRGRRNGAWQESAPACSAPVDYQVCPQCRAEAQRAIASVLSGRSLH